jgi:predicted ATP-dependent endonuclease of OLD family
MFISGIQLKNYRLFNANTPFVIKDFNVPNKKEEGSGINVFVGENGCGKTTLLNALSLPVLEYKSGSFTIEDINNPKQDVTITIYADKEFSVSGTMPNSNFNAKGFQFKARLRSRSNKAYLSSIVVTDQLFVKSDPNKPKDGSPDLRVNVYNPFSGKRFNENDFIFLDRNRYYQTKTGNFNQTRFDRLMEDFDYQYIKGSTDISDINTVLSSEVNKVQMSNKFLSHAINEFNRITGLSIKLQLVDNYHPFKYATFAQIKENKQQIKLESMGSGYEMIFSLVYSYYLACQSNKQLIILIDEPELHLHPALQEKLVTFLLKISKDSQIFISTHSALLIKQLSKNNMVKIMVIKKGENSPLLMQERKLPYYSASETNFLAFGLVTEEYHNELYEYLKSQHGEKLSLKQFDNSYFIQEKKQKPQYSWKGQPNKVSLHTFIRNQIHHPVDNGTPNMDDLKKSIEQMRSFI